MIRPCPTCDGSGIDPVSYVDATPWMPSQAEPCPTCVDMPGLRCRHPWRGELMDDEARNCQRCKGRRAYKPDPEEFLARYIGWCPVHQSVNHHWEGEWSGCHWKNNPEHWSDEECPPGVWVAVPEPLEEA